MSKKALSWDWTENFNHEEMITTITRHRACELNASPVSVSVGSLLTMLASITQAKAVLEVGGGCGVSGQYLYRGMSSDGVLTSIERDSQLQRVARVAFKEMGAEPHRLQLINANVLDTLPRLSDRGFDLMFWDMDPLELRYGISQARRLLRRGGVLVINHALWFDRVSDPADRGLEVSTLRTVLSQLEHSEHFQTCVLPASDGVAMATLLD